MEWFRFYHEAVDDPKVQRLAPVLFKHWVNLLCLASRNAERGTLPSVADLAFGLRLSEPKISAILVELVGAKLLDREGETFRMHGWAGRQKRSDDVTARVNKYRASNEDETLHETDAETFHTTLPHVRATEQSRTETETDTPKAPSGETYTAEFLQFWLAYPVKKSKADAFAAWRRTKGRPPLPELLAAIEQERRSPKWQEDGGKFIPYPGTWIRARRWEDEETDSPLAEPTVYDAAWKERQSRDAMARLV